MDKLSVLFTNKSCKNSFSENSNASPTLGLIALRIVHVPSPEKSQNFTSETISVTESESASSPVVPINNFFQCLSADSDKGVEEVRAAVKKGKIEVPPFPPPKPAMSALKPPSVAKNFNALQLPLPAAQI